MPFLANTLLQTSLWKYLGPPEIYINFNLMTTICIDRITPTVSIYFATAGQNVSPTAKGAITQGVRLLEFDAAKAFISDLDALFAETDQDGGVCL